MLPLKSLDKDLSTTKPAFKYLTGTQVVGKALAPYSAELPSVYLQGYRKGFSNPDWRSKVQQKKDATTPLELRVDTLKYMNVHDVWSYRYLGYGAPLLEDRTFTALPPHFGYSLPTSINTSWSAYKEAQNIALTYRSRYISEVTQPFQSQVFLGEIKETLDFIRHPFQKLSLLANSAKVARYNDAIKHYRQAAIRHRGGVFSKTSQGRLLLGDVADAWFEVRFAMLPLVQDITSAFKAANGRTSVRRSSFRGDSKQALAPTSQRWDYPRGFNGSSITTGEIRCSYFINTGILFDDNTNFTGFAEYLDSTTSSLVDFIPTVYELTPGSWLLDYFVNVGDILNSIATSSKVSMQYDCRTTVVEYELTSVWEPLASTLSSASFKVSNSGSLAHRKTTRRFVSRKVGTDSFPSVTFSLPTGMTELANTSLYLSRKFFNVFK